MTADRARELQQLLIWQEFVADLNAAITAESTKLLSCSQDQLQALQEKVKALKFVRDLPGHIADRES